MGWGFVGCKNGASVQQGPNPPEPFAPGVSSPTVQIPSQSPHYSSEEALEIQGFCITGHKVLLSGDSDQSVTCEEGLYQFSVPKQSDGVYYFFISQMFSGGESKPMTLTWFRQTSVPPPILVYPNSSAHFSGQTLLTITGYCQSGTQILIEGDGFGNSLCTNSQFSIDLLKFEDGVYNLNVVQQDQSGNRASIPLTWTKNVLQVIPANPQIVAQSEQVFLATGGSLDYTFTFVENNSGASFDLATRTYQAGTVAGVTDLVRVEDSLGESQLINIQVVPAEVDHLVLPDNSGDNQIQGIGQNLIHPIRARAVDRFGNGVPAVELIFQTILGDAQILSEPIQMTDSMGYTEVLVRQGYLDTTSTFSVSRREGFLPDLAESGNRILFLNTRSENNNSNQFGLGVQTGSQPGDLVVGDFNQDGYQDVALINAGEPSIGLFFGLGKGLFAPMVEVKPICADPRALIAEDVNQNGYLDLVVACGSENKVEIYLGDGQGEFSDLITLLGAPEEQVIVDVALVDLDGDNNLDLITLSLGSSQLGVRKGNGDGSFLAPSFWTTDLFPSRLATGDLNQNGYLDILVLHPGENHFQIFTGEPDLNFSAPVTVGVSLAPSDFRVGDFNGDGWPDVAVISNAENDINIFLNDEAGNFSFGIPTLLGDGPSSLEVFDYNNNGHLDVAVTNLNDGTVSLLQGKGDGTFDSLGTVGVGAGPIFVGVGDVLGKGYQDILVSSLGDQAVSIIPNQNGLGFGFETAVGANPVYAQLADLDGDGWKDLLVVQKGANSVGVFKGDGYGHFEFSTNLATGANPTAVEVADLKGNGHMDVVITQETTNTVRVYLSDGEGGYENPVDYPTGAQPSALVLADFNRNGFLDLVVANSGNDRISFFPGLGDGSFGQRIDKPTGAQPVALAAADLNRNGRLDLLVANKSDGSFSVLLSNGDGSFQDRVDFMAEAGTNGIVVGYFDVDNYIDVAVSNELAGSISVFMGNGDGTFKAPAHYFAGGAPTPIAKADVNGNGRLDFIVGNQFSQSLTVLFGSLFGDYSFTETRNFDLNPVFVGLGEARGQGALDIFVIDGIGERVRLMPGH